MTSGVSSGHEVVMKRVTGTTRAAGPPGRARGGADGGGRREVHTRLWYRWVRTSGKKPG